jgi:hypothetical protein
MLMMMQMMMILKTQCDNSYYVTNDELKNILMELVMFKCDNILSDCKRE